MPFDVQEGRFMGSVRVGPKGQIVIPKEVRDMFGIAPGDTLVLLADAKKGIAIERYSLFANIADAIFAGKPDSLHPEYADEGSREFAKGIRDIATEPDKGDATGPQEK